MKIQLALASLALLAGTLGCNPPGTCIHGDEKTEIGAICSLDYPKRACDSVQGSTFAKEDRAAGLLRCKSMGFDFQPGGGKDILFKRAKK